MALLVTDQGEIDSLRTLLNATHKIPRNLVLKLYTSNTTPEEQHVPASDKYFEPYDNSNSSKYGFEPTTGYPEVENNRHEEDQNYEDQYGILLNGNRWAIKTESSAVTNSDATGTAGTYSINVTDPANIKKGDYATGNGIPLNTYVVDIQGNDLELSQKLTADLTASPVVNVLFGRGRTTASYPEKVFTFTNAAGDVHGYYLSRANNMPYTVQGVVDYGTAAAGTQIDKTGCKGVIGYDYINLLDVDVDRTATGTSGTYEITLTPDANGVEPLQRVTGAGIPAGTTVIGKSGAVVYLSKALTGALSATAVKFKVNVAENLTTGMAVSQTATPNGVAANTTITGIDYETVTGEIGPRVYLSEVLVDNIQTTNSNDTVKFDYSKVTANGNQLKPGDVIYIAQGTTSTITGAHYTVFETPDANTFTTTPALQGTGDTTLYSSIFFAEKFTNGPYAIQNNGDQIKVTLNVSLD